MHVRPAEASLVRVQGGVTSPGCIDAAAGTVPGRSPLTTWVLLGGVSAHTLLTHLEVTHLNYTDHYNFRKNSGTLAWLWGPTNSSLYSTHC
jgi:hypothetical protein